MGLLQQGPELRQVAVGGVDRSIVGDVVAVVAQRRRVERQQPDRVDAERLDVFEVLGQPAEVARILAASAGVTFQFRLNRPSATMPASDPLNKR